MNANSMPQLPYVVSSLLAGPVARLLCFGINHNEHLLNAGSAGNNSVLPTIHPHRTANLTDVSIAGQYTSGSSVAADMEQLTATDDECSPSIGARSSLNGHQPFGVAHSGNSSASMKMSSSQQEWMLVIIFCDRVLFVFYAFIMIPRLL